MMNTKIYFISAISLAFILSFATVARAQIDWGNFTISGSAEVTGLPRGFSGHKSKFQEYRDVPETVIVPELELRIDSKDNDYFMEYDATKAGRDDQNYRFRVGKYGLWDMEFEWDQIPHRFSATGGTPFSTNDGTFTLGSKPGVAGNCPNDGTVNGWVNTCSRRVHLNLIQGFARFKMRYTPKPEWKFTASYSSQNTSGDRAFATVTNGFSNIVELAEPLDYQTHNIELGGEYAASWWTIGLKYNASLFHNNVSTMVWDNPFNTSGVGPGCVDAAGSTCRSRLDLYPSNQAHTFSLTGTASLPLKTHFMGTVSYGWRLQDDDFLPFTINPALAPFNSTASLNRKSLDGDVRPTMVNLTFVNRYFQDLDLKAFYRYYDLDNRSKTLLLDQGYIRSDTGAATATTDGLKSFPFGYSKQNVGFDAGYDFTRWLKGKFSYGWERMHREHREVLTSNEHTFGPTFDIKPNSWLLFRASYRRSLRDAHDYDAGRNAVLETQVPVDEIREERLEALRKIDEAARTRDKFSFFTQISPLENLTLHGAFDFVHDNYPRTVVGVKNDFNYSPSVGFIYAPVEWASIFGDYNYERFDWKLRAMERSAQNVAGCPARDLQTPANCPTSLWTSRGRDKIHTISLGTDLDLIKNVLGMRLQYGFSQGRSLVRGSGNSTPGNTPATDSPPISNTWHEFLARVEYALHKNVDLRFGYYFNRYSSKDAGVDIMRLWMGNVDSGASNSIFIGDRVKGDYTAHVGILGVRFKF